jgi:hypothetical protein
MRCRLSLPILDYAQRWSIIGERAWVLSSAWFHEPERLYRPEIVDASFSASDLLDLTEILEDRVGGAGAYTGSSLA